MRFLLGVVSALALTTTAALAQDEGAATETGASVPPSSCPAEPEAPPAPNAETVTRAQLEAGIPVYDAWRTAIEPILACRRSEALTARAVSDARTAEFNAMNASARELGEAWQAASEAVTARGNRR